MPRRVKVVKTGAEVQALHEVIRTGKYHAKATDAEGRTREICEHFGVPFVKKFDSKLEYRRWFQLDLAQRAGDISELESQVTYYLHVVGLDGKFRKIGSYIADFVYIEDGETVVEDTKSKSTKTPIYNWKKKHMLLEYGIKIHEVFAEDL